LVAGAIFAKISIEHSKNLCYINMVFILKTFVFIL